MQVDWAIVSVVVAVVAALVSLCSLWLARASWRQANRPLVSVFIDEVHATQSARTACFDLCVSNTGNRPALDVRLAMSDKDKLRLRDVGTTDALLETYWVCFTDEGRIAVLRNGEEVRNSFGSWGVMERQQTVRYGDTFDVTVSYRDVDGRRFRHVVPLKIFPRHGFGGSVWQTGSDGRQQAAASHAANP